MGAGARAEIEAILRTAPDILPPEADERPPVFAFTREGNAMHASWENTILGHVRLLAKELKVETNSLERADVLDARLVSLLGGRVRSAGREEKDMETLRSQAPARRGGSGEITGPDVDAAIRESKQKHYATWVDNELPALGGLTPREAAASAGHRAALVLLLKEMESGESREEEPGRRFDFGGIRRDLGM